MRRLYALLAALIVLALACGGLDEDEAPAARAATDSHSAVTFDEGGDAVAAYLQSCHATMTAMDDMGDGPIAVCEWMEFDQMCAPDLTGCWDKQQECKATCPSGCQDCEAQCTGSCDDCKTQCADGDDACLRTCAQARKSCQDTCIQTRNTCLDDKCGAVWDRCNTEFDEKLDRVCPKCSEIRSCQEKHMFNTDGAELKDCKEVFPSADDRCFDWCQPFF